jgi:hypothetical protein
LIDRYVLGLSLGTLLSVMGIIMSPTGLEHIPRLIGITRLSGERGVIVNQTVLDLLPEYGGIGMPSVSPTAVQVAIMAVLTPSRKGRFRFRPCHSCTAILGAKRTAKASA